MFDVWGFVNRYFQYNHLPDHLAATSRPFAELADVIASAPVVDEHQRQRALEKLLEAKDSFVRSNVP